MHNSSIHTELNYCNIQKINQVWTSPRGGVLTTVASISYVSINHMYYSIFSKSDPCMLDYTTVLGSQLKRGVISHCLDDNLGEHRTCCSGPTIPCWKGNCTYFKILCVVNK